MKCMTMKEYQTDKELKKMLLEVNQRGRKYLVKMHGLAKAKELIKLYNSDNGVHDSVRLKPHHYYSESDLYKIRAVNINTGEVVDRKYFANNYRCALMKLSKEMNWAIKKNHVKYNYHVVNNTPWRIYNKSETNKEFKVEN